MSATRISSEKASLNSVHKLVAHQARRPPDRPALTSLSGTPLTYQALLTQINRTIATLNARGVGRGDRVALVLPQGPDLAAAFLSIAAGATCAPLNPGYRREEFEFYLGDLQAKALIVTAGSESPAVAAAQRAGINVIELEPSESGEPAGAFSLRGLESGRGPGPARAAFAQPADTALVLHTSGTTSRPKIVPLNGANICASALHIAHTLALGPRDRCLNIMPLFHIHGLMGAVLASVAAGGEIVCTPGFDAMRFFSWVRDFEPTWYTAVPTMHQGHLGPRIAQPGHRRKIAVALHPVVVSFAAATGNGGVGRPIQGSRDRVLWDDRSGAPDGLESASPVGKKTGIRRSGGRAGHRRDGRAGEPT